jgi:hypothetical protein
LASIARDVVGTTRTGNDTLQLWSVVGTGRDVFNLADDEHAVLTSPDFLTVSPADFALRCFQNVVNCRDLHWLLLLETLWSVVGTGRDVFNLADDEHAVLTNHLAKHDVLLVVITGARRTMSSLTGLFNGFSG